MAFSFADGEGGDFRLRTSVRDLAEIVFRRKWGLLIVISTSLLVGIVWLFFIRGQVWEVSSKVMVRMGREQAPPPTMLDDRGVFLGDPLQYVNSEVDILHNRDLISMVVDSLGLASPKPPEPAPHGILARTRYEFHRLRDWMDRTTNEVLIRMGFRERVPRHDAIVDQLYSGMTVSAQDNSDVVVVRMLLPSRQGSAAVLNTLLHFYQPFRLAMLDDEGSEAFFVDQVKETSARLADVERELAHYQIDEGALDYEHQTQLLLDQAEKLRSEVEEARVALVLATERQKRLEAEMARDTPQLAAVSDFPEGSLPAELVQQIAELDREFARLRVHEVDSSVLLKNNRAQATALARTLKANLAVSVLEAQQRHRELSDALAAIQARMADLANGEVRRAAAAREKLALQANLADYQKRLEAARVNRALTSSRLDNVAIIERAVDPVRPAGPRKLLLLEVLVVLSLFGGLAWLVVVEFFDHRVHSAADLQRELGVPVLATVPLRGRHGSRSSGIHGR